MSLGITDGERVEGAAARSGPAPRGSGHHVMVTTPTGDPHVWRCYRAGLREAYEHYGVASAQNVDEARTALVLTVFTTSGRAVAGARFIGPHHQVGQVDTLGIWDYERAVSAALQGCMDGGVVDLEGVWVARDAPDRAAVTATVRQMPARGTALLGARWCVAAAAEHSLPLWRASGCEVLDVPPVPYPDERYVTRLVLWDGGDDLVPRIPSPRRSLRTARGVVVDGGTEVSW